MRFLNPNTPLALTIVRAIRAGDWVTLMRLLAENPELVATRLRDDDPCGTSRTWLHVATDWPGHFPSVAATIATLVAAGADVNARFSGPHNETPLHWAASSDDTEALDALLDAGADIEAPGGVIEGGSPLADARGFGQWKAARRLLDRGARPTLADAATLGLMDRLAAFFTGARRPNADDITRAFWGACHGGQRQTAEYLLARGADLNWVGHGGMTPLDVARQGSAEELAGKRNARDLITWLRAQGGRSARRIG